MINRVRVGKACQLLAGRQLGITEVAEAVGIPDSSYFARVFRQFSGTSPSDYRKSSRQLQAAIHPRALTEHPRLPAGGYDRKVAANATSPLRGRKILCPEVGALDRDNAGRELRLSPGRLGVT
ncbi:MAG: helix-turn-helix transcriptional regulator [Limisphaerales bacterium]